MSIPRKIGLGTYITMISICLLLVLSKNSSASEMDCFKTASIYYGIDPDLLIAIAKVESNLNPAAIGLNKDKNGNILSRDFGIMQINQVHVAELLNKGVIESQDDLITKPCLNIYVGAWILSKHFSKCGITWACLGSYNAGFSSSNRSKRKQYIDRVYEEYKKKE